MKECKNSGILPCYRDGYGVWHYSDDTHDKVYELNNQMCDIGKRLSDPLDPPSEETMKRASDMLESYLKTTRELNRRSKLPIEITEEHIKIINRFMEEKKTKKMTRAEAFEYLKCKKVDTIGLGKEVMKKLFDCGVKWANGKCEYYDFSDYLLIESNGDLYHCGNCGESYRRMHHFEEISADDILLIEIVDENRSEDELVEIVELGKKIQCLLSKLSGHRHVVITEDDVILYDEGMSLFHSDPF